jgi:hypothetical protein
MHYDGINRNLDEQLKSQNTTRGTLLQYYLERHRNGYLTMVQQCFAVGLCNSDVFAWFGLVDTIALPPDFSNTTADTTVPVTCQIDARSIL